VAKITELKSGTAGPVAPVYLVGAGPGDPELLTLKAYRLLGEADVVVYDRLVGQDILSLVPKGTSRIYVGKAPKGHRMVQEEINNLLVKLARAGRKVVRLKGGDPFIFGRGSEETAFLAQHGIPVHVVPGITAASGCAAALGVPLTHRGLASGVRFVTGHRERDGALDLNWASLADPDTTLVIYMGASTIDLMSAKLIGAGLNPDTPVAAITNGTTPEQKTCVSCLGEIGMRLRELNLTSPVLIIVGRVASLADLGLTSSTGTASALSYA
jgi:uroporphyrin-III C-methyltransferase/precorrin-2 dehydrogenase/sirohydrochlorin ferrochelatase/uroporphyrin-III C-methyltransferase